MLNIKLYLNSNLHEHNELYIKHTIRSWLYIVL